MLEAAGTPASLRTAVACARKGGKIVLLGVMHEAVALDYKAILMEEKQILGSIIYQRSDFEQAIEILTGSGIDAARHVTARFPWTGSCPGPGAAGPEQGRHIKIQVLTDYTDR